MELNRRKSFIYLHCLKLKRSSPIQHQETNLTRFRTKFHAAKVFLAAVAAGAVVVANKRLTASIQKSDRKAVLPLANRIALFV
jgi:putative intracellular protease/amidase